MVLFSGPATMADAAAQLGRGMHVVESGGGLEVRLSPGSEPVFRVAFSAEPHVAVEAVEMAELHSLPALRRLDRRFEVAFDDLGAVLDEYTTLFEVQATLQDLTGGYLFLSWNGSVVAPGE